MITKKVKSLVVLLGALAISCQAMIHAQNNYNELKVINETKYSIWGNYDLGKRNEEIKKALAGETSTNQVLGWEFHSPNNPLKIDLFFASEGNTVRPDKAQLQIWIGQGIADPARERIIEIEGTKVKIEISVEKSDMKKMNVWSGSTSRTQIFYTFKITIKQVGIEDDMDHEDLK